MIDPVTSPDPQPVDMDPTATTDEAIAALRAAPVLITIDNNVVPAQEFSSDGESVSYSAIVGGVHVIVRIRHDRRAQTLGTRSWG